MTRRTQRFVAGIWRGSAVLFKFPSKTSVFPPGGRKSSAMRRGPDGPLAIGGGVEQVMAGQCRRSRTRSPALSRCSPCLGQSFMSPFLGNSGGEDVPERMVDEAFSNWASACSPVLKGGRSLADVVPGPVFFPDLVHGFQAGRPSVRGAHPGPGWMSPTTWKPCSKASVMPAASG